MLRAKQLTNLSSTARSFLISGSRPSAADGSSCTCADDDTSRRPQTKNVVPLGPKQTSLLYRHQARVETSAPTDAVKLLSSYKHEAVERPTSLPQVGSSNPSGRSDCVNYASSCVEKDASYSSSAIPDQFARVGVAAVGFLSDVVSYKLPTTNRVNPNCMVDPAKALPKTKPGNSKYVSKENFSKVYTRPSADTSAGSKPTRRYSNDKCEKSSFGRSLKQGVSTAADGSLETRDISSDNFVKSTSQRVQPSQAVPNIMHSSDVKTGDHFSDGYRRSSRPNKMSAVVTPFAKHFANNGRIVESVSHILRNLRWGPATEEALENLNSSMDAYQANQVLKQIQDHTVASGFFYWLKRQPGFRHDDHTYTTMVGILGRAKQFDAINKLLDQMLRDGCQPNVVTYNRLIHSYGRANYLNEAGDVFNLMQKAGCEPDRVTYCTLIDIHAKAGYLEFAMEMYQRMQVAGLSPDTFTFSVIINCLGKAGHLAAATRLFSEMVEQGCVPNLVTYNTMITLQAKSRNYGSALKLYRDMQHAGFKPDKVTYSIVMEVLGHSGYLDEAEAVFFEMKRNNWVPDEPVYGLLVDLWGKAGNVEKAWEWYHAMLHTGMRPNVPTCNSLLSALLRVNGLEEAKYLLQGMLGLGLKPSLQTFTLLLSCCTEARSLRDMGVFAELMWVTGHPAHKFLISMPYAGPDGQSVRDHVRRFLDLMHTEDRESKRGLIDAVVDFLHKSGLKEEAGWVWEVAAEKNVYPDAVREKTSSYWLINLHVMSDGTAVTALSRTLAWIRRQMLISGICPSRIDIVTGWGRRSRVTGSSLVRQAVKDLLHMFRSPFFTENGNSGCFVGCGEPLRRWLLQSYVERMHLL